MSLEVTGRRPSQRTRIALFGRSAGRARWRDGGVRSLAAERADPLRRAPQGAARSRSSSEAHGEHADARARAEIARRLIMFDQTHEGASRILMRALADMGERPQALREFARCRDALKLTLDVEPSPETCALYEAIRSFSVREDKDEPAAPPAPPRKRRQGKIAPAPSRNRLRVGVLPFLAARSSRDEGVALSLSQEIAAALARFRWFDVIAPVALKRRDGASSL